MGSNSDHFEQDIITITANKVDSLDDVKFSTSSSRTAKYLSVTVTITAESREQLDALYIAFNAHPDVRMVL